MKVWLKPRNDFGIKYNGRYVTHHPLKNTIRGHIDTADRALQLSAARYAGYTWDEYAQLPGSPRWLDPYSDQLSKCDVLVFYIHNMRLEAIRNEMSMES